jgi:putative lipoic acid-binding regulatory protein
MVEQRETLIEYPCDFDIKAMGETSAEFDATVMRIIGEHVEEIREGALTTKQSSGGKFTSVTVTVYVTSQLQVDTIYRALSSHDLVKYIL